MAAWVEAKGYSPFDLRYLEQKKLLGSESFGEHLLDLANQHPRRTNHTSYYAIRQALGDDHGGPPCP